MSQPGYTAIVIIYNPNSTGSAPEKAEWLQQELKTTFSQIPVETVATQKPGHAVTIVEEKSRQYSRPLIISVSGDGGYNEVINGAMALPADSRPLCAVYPAGNANDHREATRQQDMLKAIAGGSTRKLDILCATVTGGANGTSSRFAHSYIGLGITPAVAVELNRHTLNAFREALIVIRTFWGYQPFSLRIDGKIKAFNSLVFANISRMAKVLTLSEDSSTRDGKFEVVGIPDLPKWRLVLVGLNAAFSALKPQLQTDKFSFQLVSPMPMQLDGEVMELSEGQAVNITLVPGAIDTVA